MVAWGLDSGILPLMLTLPAGGAGRVVPTPVMACSLRLLELSLLMGQKSRGINMPGFGQAGVSAPSSLLSPSWHQWLPALGASFIGFLLFLSEFPTLSWSLLLGSPSNKTVEIS